MAQRLADRLKSEPAGTELVFCGYPNMGYDSINSLPYLAPQIHYYNVFNPWDSADTPQPSGEHVFFAFLPNHEYDRQAMEIDYPGGAWQEWTTPRGESLLWLYEYNRP